MADLFDSSQAKGSGTEKPGWTDLISTGLGFYNDLNKSNKPTEGGITASTVLNNNYDIKVPEVIGGGNYSTMGADWNVNIGANSNSTVKKDNTLLFVGVGVAVVIVVIVVFFIIKKK